MSTKTQALNSKVERIDVDLADLQAQQRRLRVQRADLRRRQLYLYAGVKPGDKLECIETQNKRLVKNGTVFTVRGLERWPNVRSTTCVLRLAAANGADTYLYAAPLELWQWFRKVK